MFASPLLRQERLDEEAGRRVQAGAGTPHDLRRTCLTKITKLGFGRDAMDRIANHKGGVTDVYDRHSNEEEDKRIIAAVGRHVLSIFEGTRESNVVALR
jgi:integrase